MTRLSGHRAATTERPPVPSAGIVADMLNVYYGRHRALEEDALTVPAGSALHVAERSGPTLLRSVVNGFGVQVRGDLLVMASGPRDGHRRGGEAPRIAFVPDDRRYPAHRRGEPARRLLGSRSWKSDVQRVLGLFPFLEPRSAQLATTLSGGEQQALAIARAAVRVPRSSCSTSRATRWPYSG